MQRKFPSLGIGNLGVGAEMRAIWLLLRSKEESDQWNHHYRGGLKSAIAGRQYTQSRCFIAGLATHDRCLVCVYDLMLKDGIDPETDTPPNSILQRCQVGTLHHRDWICQHSADQRFKGVSDHIVAAAVAMKGTDPMGDRGLAPAQVVPIPPRPTEDTFEWVLERAGGILT